MSNFKSLMTLAVTLVLAACGGSGSGFSNDGSVDPTDPTDPTGPEIAAVTVLASSPTIPSDNTQTVQINVVVRDTNNVAVEGITVIMSTDSGFLTIDNAVTDASGIATATLNNGGDPTNRPITVTADASGVTASVTVNVVGTDLSLTGPNALAQGDSGTYTVVLTDAAGEGIGGQTVDVTSSAGNTISATSLTTDASGQAQFQLTAAVAGDDDLTASALGIQATRTLSVSDDSFAITTPAGGAQIELSTPTTVTVNWEVGGTPQAGETISFSSTRGTLSSPTATTDASGNASVTISSTNAGGSTIEATNPDGTSTQVTVQFVATQPATIDVQANPFTIGPDEQSSITAIVRDSSNNLVTGATVVFELTDTTGGQLSVGSAQTNTQGRATTFYTSSSTTSANNGVRVTASIQSNPSISDFVDLTVAQREVFISLGTGNDISEPNEAQYRKVFAVQVSDSQGNGVEGVTVQVGILSDAYYKGFYTFIDPVWVPNQTAGPCADEDVNRNGQLDAGEDNNGSGRIEAGNIATVSAQGGGGSLVTDVDGSGLVNVVYPQEFANWVDVTLTATTSVQGTEFAESSSFRLTVAADDIDDSAESPPGNPSPFGTGSSCNDTL